MWSDHLEVAGVAQQSPSTREPCSRASPPAYSTTPDAGLLRVSPQLPPSDLLDINSDA